MAVVSLECIPRRLVRGWAYVCIIRNISTTKTVRAPSYACLRGATSRQKDKTTYTPPLRQNEKSTIALEFMVEITKNEFFLYICILLDFGTIPPPARLPGSRK